MKSHVIEIHPNHTGYTSITHKERRCGRAFADRLLTIADAFATISIGCCTLFCMYLAYTML